MSIFPFITQPDIKKDFSDLSEFKEWAYDFDNNCLLLRGGKHYQVSKNEALKIWIYHALRTKRFVWTAYSSNYGNEIDVLIGNVENKEIVESEIKRYITECIMVNPYIQELSDFKYQYKIETVIVTFEIASIYDKFTYESEVYVT